MSKIKSKANKTLVLIDEVTCYMGSFIKQICQNVIANQDSNTIIFPASYTLAPPLNNKGQQKQQGKFSRQYSRMSQLHGVSQRNARRC